MDASFKLSQGFLAHTYAILDLFESALLINTVLYTMPNRDTIMDKTFSISVKTVKKK